MSDPIQSGGSETPGNGTAQSVPNGDGQTSAPPAPETQAQPAASDSKQLDGLWRKAYREGQGKGKERERAAILSELGVESMDALRERLTSISETEGHAADANQQAQAEQDRAEAKAIRELRNEATQLRRDLESATSENDRYRQQSARALEMDVRGRLLSLGVIDSAADDAVLAVKRNLRWSADGLSIEVFEQDNGEAITSRHSLEEYLAEFKTSKPFFFEPSRKTGSGDPHPVVQTPHSAPTDGQDWRSRQKAYRERRQQ